MRARTTLLMSGALLLLLAGSAWAAGSGGYGIPWDVVASGGEQMASDGYAMVGTMGQSIADAGSSDNYRSEAGFWPGVEGGGLYTIYLPLVLRNS